MGLDRQMLLPGMSTGKEAPSGQELFSKRRFPLERAPPATPVAPRGLAPPRTASPNSPSNPAEQ
jgi:hypothetical protein